MDFRAVLDGLADAIVASDATGRVVYLNPSAERLLGWARAELLEEVWGYSGEVYSRTVDTHVAELRRKLEENAAEPRHILTVRKTGYRIQG